MVSNYQGSPWTIPQYQHKQINKLVYILVYGNSIETWTAEQNVTDAEIISMNEDKKPHALKSWKIVSKTWQTFTVE